MHHEEQFHRRIPDRSLLTEGKKAAAADGLASSMWAQKQKRRRSRKASGVKFVRVKVDTSDLFSCRKKTDNKKKKAQRMEGLKQAALRHLIGRCC